jgi:hypothetical protein
MPPDAPHRHRWAVTDFFVVEDRPMMRQSCACGERRAIPAWDRRWDPDAAAGAGSTSGRGTAGEGL